jgi:TonB family protein
MSWRRVPIALFVWPVLLSAMLALAQDGDEDRKRFGKHWKKAEAKAMALGLVLDYDQRPKLTKMTRPKYPEGAFNKRVQGTVLLMLVIDTAGNVSEAEVLESVKELDEASITCVKEWRFKPALKDGQAVGTLALAPVKFRNAWSSP